MSVARKVGAAPTEKTHILQLKLKRSAFSLCCFLTIMPRYNFIWMMMMKMMMLMAVVVIISSQKKSTTSFCGVYVGLLFSRAVMKEDRRCGSTPICLLQGSFSLQPSVIMINRVFTAFSCNQRCDAAACSSQANLV